ncbi:hypothetical protein WG66_000973 [Moniliophthora roreri]|nr:hypothetical protein WG66_000973 [Moniliophthora roreri]
MHRILIHILALFVFISCAFARPINPRMRSGATITRFSYRKPSRVSEKVASYIQGIMMTLTWTTEDTDGKDIFMERELEEPIYISVQGLPPPAYSAHNQAIGVDEQRKMLMEIAGLGRTLDN